MHVVWRKASTFDPQGQVSTWILGIAYRICLKAQANTLSGEHLPLDEAEDLIPGTDDRTLAALELDDWVGHLFEQLPLEQRAVLELTYHQDLKYSEIAEILGCPENTVKTRVFHARKKIRALMPDAHGEAVARLGGTT
jgi:RNA polymerase sigma-70 factor (ECF subfamily)